MEVLQKNNSNLTNTKKITEYGGVCPNCESVFIFDDTDIIRPRCVNYKEKDCKVICPVCNQYISVDKCTKFESNEEKTVFRRQYGVRCK